MTQHHSRPEVMNYTGEQIHDYITKIKAEGFRTTADVDKYVVAMREVCARNRVDADINETLECIDQDTAWLIASHPEHNLIALLSMIQQGGGFKSEELTEMVVNACIADLVQRFWREGLNIEDYICEHNDGTMKSEIDNTLFIVTATRKQQAKMIADRQRYEYDVFRELIADNFDTELPAFEGTQY